MSETSIPNTTVHTGPKGGRSTLSSHTRARLDSVSRRLPRLNISRPVYIGPGYSASSTPYRITLNRVSILSPSISTHRRLRLKRPPKPEPPPPSVNPRSPVPPLPHKSILKEHSQRKEPTATTLHILDILRKAAEGNKKIRNDILNPYLQISYPPAFSAKKPEEAEVPPEETAVEPEADEPTLKKPKKRLRDTEPQVRLGGALLGYRPSPLTALTLWFPFRAWGIFNRLAFPFPEPGTSLYFPHLFPRPEKVAATTSYSVVIFSPFVFWAALTGLRTFLSPGACACRHASTLSVVGRAYKVLSALSRSGRRYERLNPLRFIFGAPPLAAWQTTPDFLAGLGERLRG
ncbi:hypothetical protein L0F63_000601 [Massospora cicadina]|nr:hypothetical protein L0F63_000601 [Massospora cicadina]